MSTTVRADFFVPVESGKQVLAGPGARAFSGDFSADFASLNRGILPIEAGTRVASDAAAPAESALRVSTDAAVPAEAAALLFLDSLTPTEQNSAAAALLKTDAALAIEILRIARGDAPASGESRGTYVVGVTLTLSDGRVITFATG
jgi:hypothetical protein